MMPKCVNCSNGTYVQCNVSLSALPLGNDYQWTEGMSSGQDAEWRRESKASLTDLQHRRHKPISKLQFNC